MLYRHVVPGLVGMSGAANAEADKKSWAMTKLHGGAPSGRALPYGFFGGGAGGACGAGTGGFANIGGMVGTAAGGGVDVVIGFSRRSCCIASPAQILVRYLVSMVSQMRRASSFRCFAFRM